ncbi:hypothetical protein QBC34DRAFT_142009 [Podospora aff. communis PSN243]|uniref:Fungal-type protein kinase domain-containing protein n=1 Tax=Podospora aff. communis PSN243 TaxID=3040156 RepID=A0AAV9GH14_9PEZI|nr:hypothetical protein QBC34DRAFT_142009 [Podospora aff. communis PSN243]
MADKRAIAGQLDRLTLYPATPPETVSPNSPTPSVGLPVSGVDKIIARIHNYISGQIEKEEWWCISLGRDEFKAFKARFKVEGNYRWPKYDYFPQLAQFVLRMAGTVNEAVTAGFIRLVTRQLYIIEQSNDQVAADFAQGVLSRGSPEIEAVSGGSHHPDGSFAHRDATELGVILEVSHSQKRQDLLFLADEYILGSNGLTQAVIGIDLQYQGKEARVIVWRPNKTEENGETILVTKKTFEGIFRDANGSLVNGGQDLRIWLKDFGNKLDCPGIQKAQGVTTISFAQLYELVQESEAFDQTRKRRRGSGVGGRMRFSRVEADRRWSSGRRSAYLYLAAVSGGGTKSPRIDWWAD